MQRQTSRSHLQCYQVALYSSVLIIAFGILSPLFGQDTQPDVTLRSWSLNGIVRSRVEGWQWFTPNVGDPTYAFMGNHLRLSLSRSGKRVDVTAEVEAPILLGLPADAVAPGAQGQLGLGGTYFVSNDYKQNVAGLFPKQVFIRIKNLAGNEASSLRIGRFEFQDGGEVAAPNPTAGVIKRDRVNQRFLGPFVFTHVMRSFDGLHYAFNKPRINYTVIGAFPTRGVFQVDGWGWTKTAFAYTSATGQVRPGKPNTGEWRLFGIYYHDWRRILKQDNRPAAIRNADTANIRIGTYGGHYLHVSDTSLGAIDFLAIGAGQFGKWGQLEHRAGMVDVEAGFQPKVVSALRPWVRAGYYYGTGDGKPDDHKHSTLFQVLPTARPFARFPFFNMTNNEDRFAMLTIRPSVRVTLKSEVHALRLANRNDLWYSGGGMFQPWTFGYSGRPSGGSRSLANLYDLSVDVTVNPRTSWTLYYGYARAKSVIRSLYPSGQKGQLGYIELTYRF